MSTTGDADGDAERAVVNLSDLSSPFELATADFIIGHLIDTHKEVVFFGRSIFERIIEDADAPQPAEPLRVNLYASEIEQLCDLVIQAKGHCDYGSEF